MQEKDAVNYTSTFRFGTFKYLKTEPNPMFLLHFDKTTG